MFELLLLVVLLLCCFITIGIPLGILYLLPEKKKEEIPESKPEKIPYNRCPISERCRKHLPALLKEQGYKCNNPFCATDLWFSIAEADHIFPKFRANRSGWPVEKRDAKSNLQALCKPCNRSKGTKLWGVFLEEERIKCHFAGAGNMVYVITYDQLRGPRCLTGI